MSLEKGKFYEQKTAAKNALKEAKKNDEPLEAKEAVAKKQAVFVIKTDTVGSVEIIESIIKKVILLTATF